MNIHISCSSFITYQNQIILYISRGKTWLGLSEILFLWQYCRIQALFKDFKECSVIVFFHSFLGQYGNEAKAALLLLFLVNWLHHLRPRLSVIPTTVIVVCHFAPLMPDTIQKRKFPFTSFQRTQRNIRIESPKSREMWVNIFR